MNANEMKAKLEELKEQSRRLHNEIEQLEKDYAEAACPWPKNTLLVHRTGKRYIVDEVFFWFDDWCVGCTFIRKDDTFGSTTESISASQMQNYRVLKGYLVTDERIVRDTKELLAAWQDAVK